MRTHISNPSQSSSSLVHQQRIIHHPIQTAKPLRHHTLLLPRANCSPLLQDTARFGEQFAPPAKTSSKATRANTTTYRRVPTAASLD